MLKKLKKETISPVNTPLDFEVLDIDELLDELNVIDKAKRNGRQNNPPTSAVQIDSDEQIIRNNISDRAKVATNKTRSSIELFKSELAKLSIEKEVNEVETSQQRFQKTLDVDIQREINNLDKARSDALTAEDELTAFKSSNKLRRSADYPESKSFTYGLFLFIFVLESLMNGYFFSAGSDFGLIGGVMLAFLIAFINIGMGVVNGFVLRFANHINTTFKSVAISIAFIMTLISVIFNLLVAHYREALLVNPDSAHTEAINAIQQNGLLSIGDVNSWLLFILGFLFFLFANYKSYGMDDAYPGYGKLTRRRNELLGDMEDHKAEIIDAIDELHEEIEADIDTSYEELKKRQDDAELYVTTIQTQLSIYRSHLENLKENYQVLISKYREANIAERDEPAPNYFSDTINTDFTVEPIASDYIDMRDKIRERVEGISGSLSEIKSSLLEIKEKYIETVNKKAPNL